MKVKDGGFQHDENHANCRSKGKSCGPANSNCPVDHPVGVFHDEVLGVSPGVRFQKFQLGVVSTISDQFQVSRAAAAFPCRARLNRSLPRPGSMGHCLVDI